VVKIAYTPLTHQGIFRGV